MKQVHLSIDGHHITADEGKSVLYAALDAGIYIPHLCSHPCIPVQSTCKLCVVEISGENEPVTACSTKIEEGMKVITESEQLNHLRKVAMELMLAGHPKDCTGCRSYTNCELQSLLQYLGVTHARMHTIRRKTNRINIVNPLIDREMERCVQCGRCVRVCRDVRGAGILQYNVIDGECYIGTQEDRPLREVDCRFCSACVEICPTGALQDARGVFREDLPRHERLIPCQAECPAHIDIPGYVRAVKEGRPSEAVAIIREKVPFPSVLGYICNHLCETGCKRQGLDDPLAIRNLKRFAVENDTKYLWKNAGLKKESTGRKVAIIGSGPCGLTAAFYLNKLGHDVTVYEKKEKPGGPLTNAIPRYRMPAERAEAEVKYILDSGVRCICSTEIRNIAELKEDYDAVLIAVGVSKGRKLTLPGADKVKVYTAIDVLDDVRNDRDINYLGKSTCVIGGGSVGFDCARSLVRKGLQVKLACLEQADAILADKEDQIEGAEEGVVLYPGSSFEAIEGNDGQVTGLRIHKVLSSTYDRATGRVTEVAIEGSQNVLECESIIFATGQHTGLKDYKNVGILLNNAGYPVDPQTGKSGFYTSIEGVFAAGDAITGISFVIKAIASAREVVPLIDRYLGGDGNIEETLVERQANSYIGKCKGIADKPRIDQGILSPEKRIINGESNVYKTYSCSEAKEESSRCLQCDLRLQIEKERLWSSYDTVDVKEVSNEKNM